MHTTDTQAPRSHRILVARIIWVSLAAVCIIVAVLILRREGGARPDPIDVHWRKIGSPLPRALFSSEVDPVMLANLPGDQDADLAVTQFRTVLHLEGDHLMVREAALPSPGPGPGPNPDRAAPTADRVLRSFEVLDPSHLWRATISAALPPEANRTQAWLLTLPDLDLFASRVTGEVETLGLPGGDTIGRGLVLFTYEGDAGDEASEPRLVVFEDREN